MEVSLKVKKPKGGTKTYKVSKSVVVVGRGKDCDMQILSTEVSRQHCRISIGDDQVTVTDLGSANGTNINGVPIQAEKDTALVPNSLIEIGPLQIRVLFELPEDVINGSSTIPATQDGTVLNENVTDERFTAIENPPEKKLQPDNAQSTVIEKPAPATPQDEETLEELSPVVPTQPASVDDLASQTVELTSIGELDDGVEFDMTAVPEDVQSAELEELEELEPAEDEAVAEGEQKPAGLKSLFGMLGRGKKDSEPAPPEEPTSEAPVETVPAGIAPPAPAAEAAIETEEVDETVDEDELDQLLEELDEDELEALLAEEGLADGSTTENLIPQPPADPGLNDFLNQMGNQ